MALTLWKKRMSWASQQFLICSFLFMVSSHKEPKSPIREGRSAAGANRFRISLGSSAFIKKCVSLVFERARILLKLVYKPIAKKVAARCAHGPCGHHHEQRCRIGQTNIVARRDGGNELPDDQRLKALDKHEEQRKGVAC
jgi:hypothetical protein